MKIKIEPEDIEVNTTDKYLKLALSTKYLQNFVKARNICGNTSMSISKEAPIKMTYDIGDGGFIHSYIAPKTLIIPWSSQVPQDLTISNIFLPL